MITTSSWARGAVIPQNFRGLADELVKRGHPTLIVVAGRKQELEQDGPLSVRTWPSKRPRQLKDYVFFFRLLGAFHPDCVIGNFSPGVVAIVVAWVAGMRIRMMYDHSSIRAHAARHGFGGIRLRFQIFRRRRFLSLATHILVVSNALKQELVEFFHVDPKKCYVFLNSLQDPSKNGHPPKSEYSRTNRIVCTSRLIEEKGQRILLRAFAKVLDKIRDASLVLIGDGDDRATLVTIAQDLGIAENCVFLGAVPHDQVLDELRQATVAAVPTLQEGFGLVVLEALAMGVPVIASNVGGIPEIVTDGREGYLVPPSDVERLAERIILLLENQELCEQMGRQGRQTFLSRFEQTEAVHEQVDWLEQVTSS